MANKIGSFNVNKLLYSVLRWGSIILVIFSIILLSILSFVTNLGLSPSIRKITTFALVGSILNYLIWDTFYKDKYTSVMSKDIEQIAAKKYSVHKRYYDARKGLTQDELRQYIREYNLAFVKAWLEDVEDATGLSVEQIMKTRYRGNSHKFLIWRVKHRKYPKSGIRSPRQLLSMLSVGKSENMKVRTNADAIYLNFRRARKIITSIFSMFFAASIVYDFIQSGWEKAIVQVVIGIGLIFGSLFFGSMSGLKGAQIKLSATEEVCELLEEWRKQPPKINKYDMFEDESTDNTEETVAQEEVNKPVDMRVIEIG